MPRVSVILTTRNRASMLYGAIDAILKQTFRGFELIVMDDASTDGTCAVVKCFPDPRLIYIRRAVHRGSAENWDEGLRRSMGEYILQQHDDDLPHPTLIEREVAMLDEDPGMMMVGTNVRIMDGEGKIILDRFDAGPHDIVFDPGCFIRDYMETRFTFKCSTQMMRRRGTPIVEQAKARANAVETPKHIGCLGDIFNICRCNTYGRVGYIADPLLDYRVHTGSETFHADVTASDIALHEGLLDLCKGGLKQHIPTIKASLLRHQILDALNKGDRPIEMLQQLGGIEALHPKSYSLPVWPDGRARGLKGKTVAIFGSFLNAYFLAEECLASGVRVMCFLDDSTARQGRKLDGLPIHPAKWLQDNRVDAVLISSERRPKEQVEANIRQYTDAVCIHWKELQ